jgi:hypothetical protein
MSRSESTIVESREDSYAGGAGQTHIRHRNPMLVRRLVRNNASFDIKANEGD